MIDFIGFAPKADLQHNVLRVEGVTVDVLKPHSS